LIEIMTIHAEKVPLIARLIQAWHEADLLHQTSTHGGGKDKGNSRHGWEAKERLFAELRAHNEDNQAVHKLLALPPQSFPALVATICDEFAVWGNEGGVQHQNAEPGKYPADAILKSLAPEKPNESDTTKAGK
jgi:hypothetical protein